MKINRTIFLLSSCWMLILVIQKNVVHVSSFSAPSPTSRRHHHGSSAISRLKDIEFLPTTSTSNSIPMLQTILSKPQVLKEIKADEEQHDLLPTRMIASGSSVFLVTLTMTPEPAVAVAVGLLDNYLLQSSLVSYGHIFSILAITGCLIAERLLIQTDMTPQEEKFVNQIDLIYGLLAAILIGSGFARAIEYGKGGEYYIHEMLFWIKMTLSGIWGGLSIFPTMIFRQRREELEDNSLEPPSEALVNRLHSIINAEISAIWTIPLLASLMSNGIGYYSPDLWWEGGALISILATVGSFWYYGKQAMTWSDNDDEEEQEAVMEAVVAKEEEDRQIRDDLVVTDWRYWRYWRWW